MATLANQIHDATQALSGVTETPRLDAEILAGHALGLSRSELLTCLGRVTPIPGFHDLVERRKTSEPIAYILGEWEFFSLDFEVGPPVLVPRPETEHLVEVILERFGEAEAQLLEIGTGTGCVSVAIAIGAPKAHIVATDVSEAYVALAQRNALRHGVGDRIAFRCGSFFDALDPEDGPFDAIFSNPPYVEDGAWDQLPAVIHDYEDSHALLAGPEGLDALSAIVQAAPLHLRPSGLLALEIGMGQYEAVRGLLVQARFYDVQCQKDLAGIDRIIYARVQA